MFGTGTIGGTSTGGGDTTCQPEGIGLTLAPDEPATEFAEAAYADTATPDALTLAIGHDTPSLATASEYTANVTPTGLAVPVAVDAPTGVGSYYVAPTPRDYGDGAYSVGNYGKGTGGSGTEPVSLTAAPDPIAIPVTITAPGGGTVNDPPPPPATSGYGAAVYGAGPFGVIGYSVTPDGLTVDVTLGGVSTNGQQATGYGGGTYGLSTYGTTVAAPPAPTAGDGTYGAGAYGAGAYEGTPGEDDGPITPPDDAPGGAPIDPGIPLPGGFIYPDDNYRAPRLPGHILGIGPWNNGAWRGAPNYGVKAGGYASVPLIALPDATSKSFTLRLDGGGEARSDHDVSRYDAIVIEQMATDLWWRRNDVNTRRMEVIGRYNADKVDIAGTDGGLRISVSWVDYQALLEDRLVTTYKDPTNSESMWSKATTVNNIIAFALPNNMGIDYSAVSGAARVYLGVTKEPFELPLGTPIGEVMTNLQSISVTPWEWWVEMPADAGARPKLMLTTGQRGSDKGVTLFDIDGHRGPIASWTMQAAADRYANAVYFQGGTGGGVYVNDPGIALYGQRDATGTDSSLAGNVKLIDAAAAVLLAKLSDRRPTFTLQLREGFWEGRHHIDVGDWITIHIRLGEDLISDKYRVSEINVEVDINGREQVGITVGAPRPARDPRSRQSAVARLVRRLKNYERKGP